MSVSLDQIGVSDKFKHNNEGFNISLVTKKVKLSNRYVSFYHKWVDTSNTLKTGAKACLFLLKMTKCEKNTSKFGMWLKVVIKLGIKFHSEPVYDKAYIKAKVRELDVVIKTNFLGNDKPKEKMLYACIAYITIDSVMRIDKKNDAQVYLEECKYRVKKIQMSRFINTELKSDSDSELDSEEESKFDAELMAKLESGPDSE